MSRYINLKFMLTFLLILSLFAAVIFAIVFFTTENNDTVIRQMPRQSADKSSKFSAPVVSVSSDDRIPADSRLWQETREILAALNGYKLPSGTVFSYQEWSDTAGVDARSADAKSASASLIFEAATRLGLEFAERNTHLVLPSFNKPGFDVQIATGSKDLTLRNPFRYDIRFSLTRSGGSLVVQLSTNSAKPVNLPSVTVTTKVLPFEKVLLDNKSGIASNLPKIGANGSIVKLYSTSSGEGKSLLSRDYYPAQPQYIFGSAPVETQTSQPDEFILE